MWPEPVCNSSLNPQKGVAKPESIPVLLRDFGTFWDAHNLWEGKYSLCWAQSCLISHVALRRGLSSLPSTSHSVLSERMPKILGKMLWSL